MIAFFREYEEHGYLSNWYPTSFRDPQGQVYCCSEQYYLTRKALMCGSTGVAKAVLATSDPREMKALTRPGVLSNYSEALWTQHRLQIMFEANWYKFTQQPELKAKLLATGTARLVEASPYDRVWGTGVGLGDPRLADPARWPGQNLLGQALEAVRYCLQAGTDGGSAAEPPSK